MYLPGRRMWKEEKFRFIRSVDRCRSLLGSDASECNPCGTCLSRYDGNHNFTQGTIQREAGRGNKKILWTRKAGKKKRTMAEGGRKSDGKRRVVWVVGRNGLRKTVDATPLPTRDSNPATAAAASAAVETSSVCLFDCRCASIRSGITLFPRRFHHSLVPFHLDP